MKDKPLRNLPASVRQRLLNLAKAQEERFQRTLTRFALERLLYRLSRSEHRDHFVLKGAWLFLAWSASPHRFTKDLDLWGQGPPSVARLEDIFRGLCRLPLEPGEEDGMVFLPETVVGTEIREENLYGGIRILFTAMLETARIPLQVDVGFGDAITPAPQEVELPVLLPFPAPRLRAYRRETVIAEKLEAMVILGMNNSRMKDFYDLWVLSQHFTFDGPALVEAIAATFARRGTPLPAATPVALTDVWHSDALKQTQWQAFIRRSLPTAEAPSLSEVLQVLGLFLLPPLESLARGESFTGIWPPGGIWTSPVRS